MKHTCILLLSLLLVAGCDTRSHAPIATPMPTPNAEILRNPFDDQPRPWLMATRTDGAPTSEGLPPDKAVFVSQFEPVVTRDGDGWKITFK